MTWNTLDVPLGIGWQCILIPRLQYHDLTGWGRGYRNLSARQLYPNAGQDKSAGAWNARPLSEVDKGELWEQDRLKQLADDRAAFARYFRPNWDLRTITGEKALRDVQNFVRDRLNLAHWNLPTDNGAVRKLLGDAVASGDLVPIVNREYRGVPRVAQPDPAPQHWPVTGGGYGYSPKVLTGREFTTLKRANGELPALDAVLDEVGATRAAPPDFGAPARAGDGFGLSALIESAAGALPGNDDTGARPTSPGGAKAFEYGGDDAGAFGDDMQTAWLPSTGGPSNQWVENTSGKQQWRLYDRDGNAAVDIDFGHDHGFGAPHAHNWDDGVRDDGNAFSLLPY